MTTPRPGYRVTARLTGLTALVFSLLLSAPSHAQMVPLPNLQAVFPMGGKAGREFEVTVSGITIDGHPRLLFSHAGITATPVMLKPDRFYPTERQAPNRFTVRIAKDVPPGGV